MSSIVPNPEQIQALLTDPDQGPVVMLNLLKFKERADGEEGSGADAYRRYGDAVIKMVEARGGKVLWSGRASHVLIGNEADHWDAIALVQYPSPRAFLEMAMSSEYQKIHGHREAGLDRTVLIACRTIDMLEAR
ncbi:MAG TPA: DUF1330 domain-containing protein [Candidatus Binataceae bacterium]|nr:DUF1330 domain-containing protein [Candidatus Binataceae bacterium]